MDSIGLSEDGLLTPQEIANQLRTTSVEVLRSAGLEREAMKRDEGLNFDETQRRLQEMVGILNKVAPRLGSTMMAYAWYRSYPLPGFSGQTPMQLVLSGKSIEVLEYVDAADAGIHA